MSYEHNPTHTMNYRLALDLGTTSLGWAMIRLNANKEPTAIIKAGVRIFSDGRNPKDGSSLAVTRRDARSMRRRRDRLLKRKARMMRTLIEYGFFPKDAAERKALELLNPFALRARGLDEALTPAEFARALFHINQRRGFKSNRKTDKGASDASVMKSAINTVRQQLCEYPKGSDNKWLKIEEFDFLAWVERRLPESKKDDKCRTVGELLCQRMKNGDTVRAKNNGLKNTKLVYDLYIDRQMIEDEFDALWAKQAQVNPTQFTENARADLKDVLLHQRPLRPVKPGRCTLEPDEERAPLALPSVQRARIYQEANHLRILGGALNEQVLSLAQRDNLVAALEAHNKRTFTQIKKLLGLGGAAQFNFEDPKRQELKGNTTSAILSGDKYFGAAWFNFDEAVQDEIVMQIVKEESETALIRWLQTHMNVDEATAERIANAGLPEGYGSLSAKAMAKILPELRREVITYDKAVLAAGYAHHSHLNPSKVTGEILPALPYYGEPLQRFVGFGTNNIKDTDEKRYGRIANPTVHVGLNQVRTVVNALIKRYGHPSEVIVEVARDLKQSREQREEENKRQAANQTRNKNYRKEIADLIYNGNENLVKQADIQKMILWKELNIKDALDRRCPYSGGQIGERMLFTDQIEIEHILPFSITLDDSLNNKTVSMRSANRDKGNRTPWQAFGERTVQGYDYQEILQRAELMPKGKRYRFAADGYQQWLREDKDFLARALNDTRYLSRVAKEYLTLICPQNTRVIPGQMTALLRAKFGLNDILGLEGVKNRNDHRHHAVDACVIGVTDQGLLQRFATASATTREKQIDKLVEKMPDPWPTYREHAKRAIAHIYVSHKPDHSYEGQMHEDTAYRPPHKDSRGEWRTRGINGVKPNSKPASNTGIVQIKNTVNLARYGNNGDAFKGYVGGNNYCIDIFKNQKGKWEARVITVFEAYQIVKTHGKGFFKKQLSIDGLPLIMRLIANDCVRMKVDGVHPDPIFRVQKMRSDRHQVTLVEHKEANAAEREKEISLFFNDLSANSLSKRQARRVTISPIGEVNDPGFKE